MDKEKILSNFKRRGYNALWFETGADAAAYLCGELQGTDVGFGGSVTVQQLGLFEKLGEKNRVFWHWVGEDRTAAQKCAAEAKVYILSANAVSEAGEIVNIDGNGNRLAAQFFGHDRVVFLIGANKVTPNLPSAIDRARNVAAPLNARRLKKQTPCALSEPMRCHDCSSPDRICSGMSILYKKMGSIPQIDVLLIGEDLGY